MARQSLGSKIMAALGGNRRRTPAPAPPSGRPSTRPKPRSGAVQVEYAPHADGHADPGEVVWTWVAYEDDPKQGKDRPVLVIGRTEGRLAALMLTSKDHDRDAEQEAHWGRHWMDVGTGDWDRERRPSEVRLDRLLVVDAAAVRREGAALDRATFDAVIAARRALS